MGLVKVLLRPYFYANAAPYSGSIAVPPLSNFVLSVLLMLLLLSRIRNHFVLRWDGHFEEGRIPAAGCREGEDHQDPDEGHGQGRRKPLTQRHQPHRRQPWRMWVDLLVIVFFVVLACPLLVLDGFNQHFQAVPLINLSNINSFQCCQNNCTFKSIQLSRLMLNL